MAAPAAEPYPEHMAAWSVDGHTDDPANYKPPPQEPPFEVPPEAPVEHPVEYPVEYPVEAACAADTGEPPTGSVAAVAWRTKPCVSCRQELLPEHMPRTPAQRYVGYVHPQCRPPLVRRSLLRLCWTNGMAAVATVIATALCFVTGWTGHWALSSVVCVGLIFMLIGVMFMFRMPRWHVARTLRTLVLCVACTFGFALGIPFALAANQQRVASALRGGGSVLDVGCPANGTVHWQGKHWVRWPEDVTVELDLTRSKCATAADGTAVCVAPIVVTPCGSAAPVAGCPQPPIWAASIGCAPVCAGTKLCGTPKWSRVVESLPFYTAAPVTISRALRQAQPAANRSDHLVVWDSGKQPDDYSSVVNKKNGQLVAFSVVAVVGAFTASCVLLCIYVIVVPYCLLEGDSCCSGGCGGGSCSLPDPIGSLPDLCCDTCDAFGGDCGGAC